jgi:2-oxo-4-hydroxy-4-carboxy--5-ureidoimidazoline (OHCU) decarboxylase
VSLLPIADLNQLAPRDFADALRPLFEAGGPLAEALYAGRPYPSYAVVIERAERIAAQLPIEAQVEVVNAHPRIGANPSTVSSLSYGEQGYDREASLPAAELQRVYAALGELNSTYEEQFGFRFVVFVNKRPKSEIVEVLRDRLRNSRTSELETALHDLFAIARDRHQQLA